MTDPTDLAEHPPAPIAPRFDTVWPPRTQDGMILPHKLNWATFLKAVPGVFAEGHCFDTVVPEEYVAMEYTDDGEPIAIVSCPCGEEPAVSLGHSKACNCGRIFLQIGRGVVRAFRPDDETEEPSAPKGE